jgi:hypothetical protein
MKRVRMMTAAQIPAVPPTIWLRGSQRMHAKASWPTEQDFSAGHLLSAGAGHVAVIAESLPERRHREFATPREMRGIIDRFPVEVLAGAGRRT